MIEITADRTILDADNIGGTNRSREILVLGLIFPYDIKSFKRNSDERSSELYDSNGGFVRDLPKLGSNNTKEKNPKDWLYL